MKSKKILEIAIGVFLLATLVYIFSGIKGKKQPQYTTEFNADAKGVEFTTWAHDKKDRKIRKALKLKCSEQVKESEDKTLMKNIDAVIFKKGRMNKDIKVFGDQGFTENNYNNFFLEKNARIVSQDFIVTSESFTLKDLAELSSASHVYFQTEVLNGTASNGMNFYLDLNTIKFFDAKGTYKRDNRKFSYRCSVLWFIEKDKMLVMERDVVIKDDHSLLESGWVTVKFNQELNHVVETSSQIDSYFYMEDREKNEVKEIKAENISSYYDTEGHLTTLKVMKNGRILLKDRANRILITAPVVEMNIDGPTGKTKEVKIPLRGVVENTGKTRFEIAADSIHLQYNREGKIRYCEGTGNVRFIVEDYKGSTPKFSYDIEKDTIAAEGAQSQVQHEKNTFTSAKFIVNVKNKVLSSTAGVKSLIVMPKENALFSIEPIYINAGKVTIFDKEKKFTYEGQVNLSQEETQMTAGSLEIGENNAVAADGSVSLSFKKGDKDLALKGDHLTFDPDKKQIQIIANAIVKSGESILRAKEFEIQFNDKNEIGDIAGEEDIYFSKEGLSGASQRVQWLFSREVMVFKGAPQVTNAEGHKTTGKELKIDLKTDKITITAADAERSETIIK